MARTSVFSFTNVSEGTHPTPQVALGLTTNYAVATDTADTAVLNNKTAPMDAQEIVSFRYRELPKVNNSLNIQYPAKVSGGIQYGVQVEETLTTTDSADPTFRVDEPIVVSITVRHPKSGNISGTIVGTSVERAVSALKKANGDWRFDDLMRSAERPIVD